MKNTTGSWPKWTAHRFGLLKNAIKPPAALALALISSLLVATAATAQTNSATRTLPSTYTPGQEITVTVDVTTTMAGWLLRETVPEGWTVTDAGGGTVQSNGREIRFPLQFNEAQSFTYKTTPSSSASGTATFEGVLTVDTDQFQVSGNTSIASSGGDPQDPDPQDPDPQDPDPQDPDPSGNVATRNLPETYTAGQPVNVSIVVTTNMSGWLLREIVPEGWTVTDAGGGTVQTANPREIRFPLQFNEGHTFNYTVTPGAGSSGPAVFSGVLTVDVDQFNVSGDTTITSGTGGDPGEPDPGEVIPVDPFTVTSADQENLPAIYNLSGTYDYTITIPDELEGVIALNYTLTHNQHGRLSGEGTMTVTEDGDVYTDDDIRVSGTVRRVGHPSEPIYRVKIVIDADLESEGEDIDVRIDHELEISGNQLVGHAHLHAESDFGHDDIEIDGIAIDLPEGRDGTWSLDFTPGTAESPTGAAVLNVPGSVLNYNLTHKGVEEGNLIVYTLQGSDDDSSGNQIRIATDGDNNIVRILGRVLGQDLTVAPQ